MQPPCVDETSLSESGITTSDGKPLSPQMMDLMRVQLTQEFARRCRGDKGCGQTSFSHTPEVGGLTVEQTCTGDKCHCIKGLPGILRTEPRLVAIEINVPHCRTCGEIGGIYEGETCVFCNTEAWELCIRGINTKICVTNRKTKVDKIMCQLAAGTEEYRSTVDAILVSLGDEVEAKRVYLSQWTDLMLKHAGCAFIYKPGPEGTVSEIEERLLSLQKAVRCRNHRVNRAWHNVTPCRYCSFMDDEFKKYTPQSRIQECNRLVEVLAEYKRPSKKYCTPEFCWEAQRLAKARNELARAKDELANAETRVQMMAAPKMLVESVVGLLQLMATEPGRLKPAPASASAPKYKGVITVIPSSCQCATAGCKGECGDRPS
jgi:hypothetical protein